MTLVPHPPYSLDCTLSDFFSFPWMKKVLKGKHSANVKEVKQKMAEALKGIKIVELKNDLSRGKNVSVGILRQMESTLKITEV